MAEVLSPVVLAAVVNYNGAARTLETLGSLATLRHEAPLIELAIDNGSDRADRERLRTDLPDGVELVELATNLGYGAACNAAIQAAVAGGIRFVWLLNNDITFEPGCLGRLLRTIEADQRLAAVAPTVVQHERPDLVLSAGVDVSIWRGAVRHRLWGRPTAELPSGPALVDALEASALLVRTEAVLASGGFDEAFFMYWEDTEWSLRARRQGWLLASVPDARIRHRLSQSSTPLDRTTYLIRNRIRMVRLVGSAWQRCAFAAFMLFGWLPAYALTRLVPRYGPAMAARAIVRPVAWNIRDALRRRRWKLTRRDQAIPALDTSRPR